MTAAEWLERSPVEWQAQAAAREALAAPAARRQMPEPALQQTAQALLRWAALAPLPEPEELPVRRAFAR